MSEQKRILIPCNAAGKLALYAFHSAVKKLLLEAKKAIDDYTLANIPDGKTIHADYSGKQFRQLIRQDNGGFAIIVYDYKTQATSCMSIGAAATPEPTVASDSHLDNHRSRLDNRERDKVFEEHQYIIRACIKRNLPLIKALYLEIEDVAQDLSLRMLNAIERYDSSRERCSSLSTFLYSELQYEILNMSRRHRPAGIAGAAGGKGIELFYLDKPLENGTMFEIPTTECFERFEVLDAINALPPDERNVTICKVRGEPIRKKNEKEAFFRAKEMLNACLCC